MDLELEPAPPDPAPPRPAPRRRRPRFTVPRRLKAWSARAVARSTALSILLHAVVFGLLWLVLTLAPRTPREHTIAVRIVLGAPVQPADPEAEAGGSDPRPEAPQEGTEGAAADQPGFRLTDEIDETAAGTGASPAGSAYLGRTAGKDRLLQAGGGDAVGEGALRAALAWLARHQAPNGTWDAAAFAEQCGRSAHSDAPSGGDRCGGAGEAPYVEATTGLALLPFLGAGHTQLTGPWKDTVRRGLTALVARQHDDGSFGADAKRGYASGIATLVLCDAYGMTRAHALREPAERAVAHIARTQSREGGWRYLPGDGESDSSVTCWAVMALAGARRAGLHVPDRTLASARAWFAGVRDADGQYGYTARGGGSAAMLGAGAFAEMLLGADPASPRFAPTFDLLEHRLPRPPRDERDNAGEYGPADPIHWMYGALATIRRGGGTWRVWNERVRDTVLGTQEQRPTDACGSWPPMGATGRHGGRVVTTALCALTLETYYRY